MKTKYYEYLEQAKIFHKASEENWPGNTIKRFLPEILSIIKEKKISSIMDYGCGKAKNHPKEFAKAYKYDPGVEEFSKKPEAGIIFDLVVSTDVLEHIPEENVKEIIDDIFKYSKKWVFLSICTREAKSFLPNGYNAHATVKPKEWWDNILSSKKNFTVRYT